MNVRITLMSVEQVEQVPKVIVSISSTSMYLRKGRYQWDVSFKLGCGLVGRIRIIVQEKPEKSCQWEEVQRIQVNRDLLIKWISRPALTLYAPSLQLPVITDWTAVSCNLWPGPGAVWFHPKDEPGLCIQQHLRITCLESLALNLLE